MNSQLVAIILPEGQQEGTKSIIGRWLKKIGDSVSAHEPVLEISTDKVTMEVAAPADGVLREIIKKENDEVSPGEVLGKLESGAIAAAKPNDVAGAFASSVQTRTSSGSGAREDLSPAVRKLLRENGLSGEEIVGSGKGGRITHEDVQAFLSSRSAAPKSSSSNIAGRRIVHSPIRKQIASKMAESVRVAPHVTTVFEADFSAITSHRLEHRAEFEQRGAKLTYTPYFIAAIVAGIKVVPEVNSRWHDDSLELFDGCNIGVATAIGSAGLMVPVIREAEKLDLFGIASALSQLVQKARDDKLESRDVQDGTFTISNHGVSGSLVASPIIINQPQSAILGVGKLENRVVAIGEGAATKFEARPKAYVTLTIDHRVLDGFSANAFLSTFVSFLENYR